MKDLGSLHFLLGLEVTASNGNLFVTQSRNTLTTHENGRSQAMFFTVCFGSKLSLGDGHPFNDPLYYCSVCGSITISYTHELALPFPLIRFFNLYINQCQQIGSRLNVFYVMSRGLCELIFAQ